MGPSLTRSNMFALAFPPQRGTCTHTTLTCSHSRDADRREQRRSRAAVVVRLSRRDDQDMALIESISWAGSDPFKRFVRLLQKDFAGKLFWTDSFLSTHTTWLARGPLLVGRTWDIAVF